MATLTIEIGRKNKKKVHPISFLVCQGTSKKRIPTDITATDSELTTNQKKLKEPTKARVIEAKRRELQDRMDALSLDLIGHEVDAAYIVERLTANTGELDFFAFADDWMKHTSTKSICNYETMLNSLEKHLGCRKLPFSSITFDMLTKYEETLKDKVRARSSYLGYIRHLYREAMRRYNTDFEQVIKHDPFLRYKVPRQTMKKGIRALTLEQLLKVYAFEGKAGSRPQLARDVFILSFCLMGMNSVDMYADDAKMRKDTICYHRQKTRDRRSDGAYIEVKVHPYIKELMKKYRGYSRLFSFHERYSDYVTFNANVNKGLKKVGKAVGIDDLEFYQARHTFATLSRNLMKFSKSDVDEALNHVGSYDIADVYITKDFTIINDNNFKLIKRVFDHLLTTKGKKRKK